MDDKNLKNFLIGMVSNVVRDIKENIFKVRVENQIKFPEEINVSNLKDVQEVTGKMTVKDLDKAIKSLEKIEKKEIKIPEQPKEIEVKDFDKLINKKEIVIPDEFTIKNIDSVVKILEDIKLKKYPEQKEIKLPDSFKISNLKDIPKTENVNVDKMDNLLEAVNGIGSLNRNEKNPIPVRLSDGKYFYKALSEVIERAISVGGVNNVGLRNTDNERVNPSTKDNQDTIIEHLQNVTNLGDSTLRIEDYYPMIAQDKIEGRSAWSKVGKILNPSTTGFEIISNIDVKHPGGIQCEVVSADANDTIAGTGVQKILLEFYDSNWVYRTEIIEMNGTTPVNTVSTDINRTECMSVYQVGTGNVAAGNITLKDTGAVNTYFQIDAKENFCPRCLHYIVPGSKSFVTDILVSSNTKEGVEFRLVVTVDNNAGAGTGGKVLIGKYATKVVDTDVPLHFNIPIKMDASNSTVGMGLFLAVKGVAAGQEAFGSMVGYDEVVT